MNSPPPPTPFWPWRRSGCWRLLEPQYTRQPTAAQRLPILPGVQQEKKVNGGIKIIRTKQRESSILRSWIRNSYFQVFIRWKRQLLETADKLSENRPSNRNFSKYIDKLLPDRFCRIWFGIWHHGQTHSAPSRGETPLPHWHCAARGGRLG